MTAIASESTVTATLDVDVEQHELVAALQFVTRATKCKSSTQLQVLSGAVLEAEGGQLTVSMFDYETSAREVISGIGSGRALVPAHTLLDLIRGLTKGCLVKLAVDGTTLAITGDGVTYRVPLLAIEDYPELPKRVGKRVLTLTPDMLLRAGDVTVAAGKDDTLPVLTAVLFTRTKGGRIELAATDRYRLTVYNTGVAYKGQLRCLVPAEAVRFVATTFKKQHVDVMFQATTDTDALVHFICGSRSVTVRTISGQFPDYERLLPASSPMSCSVDAAELETAITQVAKVLRRSAPITLRNAGGLTLSAGVDGDVTAEKTIAASNTNAEAVTICFHPGYLLDGIKAIGGDAVVIGYATDDVVEAGRKPVVLSQPGESTFRYLLMPVRLTG